MYEDSEYTTECYLELVKRPRVGDDCHSLCYRVCAISYAYSNIASSDERSIHDSCFSYIDPDANHDLNSYLYSCPKLDAHPNTCGPR